MRTAAFSIAFSLVLIAGCVQTQATMLGGQTYPPITEDQVRIYLNVDEIPGRYDQVAILHAQGATGYTNESQMYEALRRRAARIGANGVVVGNINEPGAGAQVAAAVFGMTTTRRGEALAIYVYPEE
ncbi:MAG TPA: hypothetical protein VK610_00975 [Rhodothermales bacterium]|nr:hypothetical protein [Rhodothermales bacterium]